MNTPLAASSGSSTVSVSCSAYGTAAVADVAAGFVVAEERDGAMVSGPRVASFVGPWFQSDATQLGAQLSLPEQTSCERQPFNQRFGFWSLPWLKTNLEHNTHSPMLPAPGLETAFVVVPIAWRGAGKLEQVSPSAAAESSRRQAMSRARGPVVSVSHPDQVCRGWSRQSFSGL
ncbi:hypothetical protein B0T26DRAFT_198016 [Lasiosphaeria miniovina]|uniref:Uncharacterized protein n=1 Tax=Lasiosphaeria miniovina TaxID=1954250 RepID=A0AA40DZ79_9PEZI|nr:uncharacterized protein B0T26DRAFT_198016 [Lasiosphaeria miniovina]KAK0721999.1 hypothetical protein B0T26DRAFT_198016 [Lasiosphaeria miniovina]